MDSFTQKEAHEYSWLGAGIAMVGLSKKELRDGRLRAGQGWHCAESSS
jgi:hypothetical protein